MFGFAKNDQANISDRELQDLKRAASVYMRLSGNDLDIAVRQKKLQEVRCDG
jgi:hypothetical protein